MLETDVSGPKKDMVKIQNASAEFTNCFALVISR